MPHVIYRYVIPIQDEFELMLPANSTILKVECQNDVPTMWVLHDPTKRKEKRKFVVIGTGEPFKHTAECHHIATFQQPPYVWHLFEVTD